MFFRTLKHGWGIPYFFGRGREDSAGRKTCALHFCGQSGRFAGLCFVRVGVERVETAIGIRRKQSAVISRKTITTAFSARRSDDSAAGVGKIRWRAGSEAGDRRSAGRAKGGRRGPSAVLPVSYPGPVGRGRDEHDRRDRMKKGPRRCASRFILRKIRPENR